MKRVKIGAYTSMSGDKMFLNAAEEAIRYDANCLMIYTGAPQNTRRKSIEMMRIKEGYEYLAKYNMNNQDLVIHAPYIINLANTINTETKAFAIEFLQAEITRAEAFAATHIVLHPGAHVGAGEDAGIRSIISGLNEVLTPQQNVKIALETMAGKGTECGKTFKELAQIIEGVTHNEKLAVCLDTCHMHDAGYDIVNDFDGVLERFDKIIGKERISSVHINDSKNTCGTHKDRHANIGMGTIGFDAIDYIVYHPDMPSVCHILETPFIKTASGKSVSPYGAEITMLQKREFNPQFVLELEKQ